MTALTAEALARIQALVDAAPPLSDAQVLRLRYLLRSHTIQAAPPFSGRAA